MTMPKSLVFVRHGQSEANIIQKKAAGYEERYETPIYNRPDWQHRLSHKGVKQAQLAGAAIREYLGGIESFDALYVSPFLRTRETAAHIGGIACEGWTIDDRLIERSWGLYGTMSREDQEKHFPRTHKQKNDNPWYIRLDGGESMADVYGRFRDFQGTLHREQSDGRVLAVTHGDFINAARYGVERMTPEQWEAMDNDRDYTVTNCQILEYTRVNPDDPEDVRDKLRWRRYISVDTERIDPEHNMQWVELTDRRRYSGKELLGQVAIAPNIID